MKKHLITLFILTAVFFAKGQNEIGAFYFPQLTSINNLENTETNIYTHVPTFSSGAGINYIHFFNDRYDFRNMLHKIGLRIDLMYSAHNQKFKSEWVPFKGAPTYFHEGKKRLDYIKLAINAEYFRPFSRHMSYIFYGGPQISYLAKSDGGIVAWNEREDGTVLYLLPPASNNYFKRVTVDFVIAAGLDYELTRYLNFSTSLRLDYSLTTIDNPEVIVGEFPQFNVDSGRNGSRNMSIAALFGIEYTLHIPEHSKTRY